MIRGWLSEVTIDGYGVAQAHLVSTVSLDRLVESTGINVGAVALRQIRELVGELIEL